MLKIQPKFPYLYCRELSSTFSRLGRDVDSAKEELIEELNKLQEEIRKLDDTANNAKTLKYVNNIIKSKVGYNNVNNKKKNKQNAVW